MQSLQQIRSTNVLPRMRRWWKVQVRLFAGLRRGSRHALTVSALALLGIIPPSGAIGPASPHRATFRQAPTTTQYQLLFGAEGGDFNGIAVSSAGDVNGDGFADILIGAPFADGPSNGRFGAGESGLIFGSASLPASVDLAHIGSQGVVMHGAETFDASGMALAGAGDVNGDGFADLLIGSTNADGPANERPDAGESYLIFGGASLPATIDLASVGPRGVTIVGAEAHDRSGSDVSGAGDVNGDGFADLLIGATDAYGPANSRIWAGESYVIFGSASLPSTLDLADIGTKGITIIGAEAFDRSGRVLAGAGDVNGDGFADLLIGSIDADGPADERPDAGESYLIFGGASLPATIDLASLGSGGVTIVGAGAHDRSGGTVSGAGDVNGDGFADLLIGGYDADGPSNERPDAGESYLIFGGASLPATIDLATLSRNGVTLLGAESLDRSGSAVSGAGDVNGDGFDDLLIGASSADGLGNRRAFAGESYVIFGSAFLSETIELGHLEGEGRTILGAEAFDGNGYAVSGAGDVNGDGLADILIGAPFADGPRNRRSNAGEGYVIFGSRAPQDVDLCARSVDVTEDGLVDLADVIQVAENFRHPSPDLTYDVDCNEVIGLNDVMLVVQAWELSPATDLTHDVD